MTVIEEVESGALSEFGGIPKEGRERGMAKFDADVGGAASTEGGGMSEIGWERIWSKDKHQGRQTQQNIQPRDRPTAADNGELREYDSGGTLGETPHPLGGGW